MIRRFAGLIIGTLLIVIGVALPSSAHDQIIGSTPADGAVLDEAPALIELEFSSEVIDAAPAIAIQDSSDELVHQATPEVAGRFATSPFPALPNGDYKINWSVVSSDGHRIEGTIAIILAVAVSPDPSLAPTDDPIGSTVAPIVTDPAEATPAEAEPESETTESTVPDTALGTMSTPMKVIVGIAGVAVIGAVAALAIRRLRNTREDHP